MKAPFPYFGGYGNQSECRGKANRHREALFFSPHCLVENGLFKEKKFYFDKRGCFMKNAKLWKMILNGGVQILGHKDRAIKERLQTEIITSPIIVDTRYGEIADNGMTKHPELIEFPFQKFWVEGSDENPNWSDTIGCRWGAFILVNNEGIRRSIAITAVSGGPRHPAIALGSAITVIPDMQVAGGLNWKIMSSHQYQSKINIALREVILYTFDVLDMLSCKNVGLKPNPIDSHQAKRAAKRHGGNPGDYRYHTLVVYPPGANKSTATGQDIGIMPRHICRGHFSEYGPEFGNGLLFGKYAGRFFIPPHMKGKKENGIVEKDYEIHA